MAGKNYNESHGPGSKAGAGEMPARGPGTSKAVRGASVSNEGSGNQGSAGSKEKTTLANKGRMEEDGD